MNKQPADMRLYTFDELDVEAKQRARQWFRKAMAEQEMEEIIASAQHIGLIITDYDFFDSYHVHGYFRTNAFSCAQRVLKEHSKDRPSYLEAQRYLGAVDDVRALSKEKWNARLDTLEERFLFNLSHLYLNIIKERLGYIYPDNGADLTLLINAYTFTRPGNPFPFSGKIKCPVTFWERLKFLFYP